MDCLILEPDIGADGASGSERTFGEARRCDTRVTLRSMKPLARTFGVSGLIERDPVEEEFDDVAVERPERLDCQHRF